MPKVGKSIIIGAVIGFVTGGLSLYLQGATGLVAGVTKAAIITAAKTAAIYGAIGGAVSGIAASFIKKPSMDMGAAVDRQNLTINPQAMGQWVFGETPAAMDIVFSEKINEDQIIQVVASAAHEIDSFGDFYINDELITFTGANANGDWFGALQKYQAEGTQPEDGFFIGGSWTGDGSGVAHIGLKWDFGNDENGKIEGGIPTRITQIVKGSKVYDPRLDTTRGGSGSHRADDQTTWEWSDNWALIVAHYLLGYKNNGKLVYGVGINPDDIDWLQVIAMANVCEEQVDNKDRYRVGGIIPTTNNHAQVIGQLEAAVGGKVSKIGGKYYIWCPHNDLISAGTITNNQIVREVGMAFEPTGDIRDLYNTARGRFIDPDTLYQPTPYPEIDEPTAVTDDGRVRLMERDFAIIQDESIAERVAREMVRRSRFSATWTFAMGPEGMLYQPFDVVTLNCDETDNQDQLVRIIAMDYSPAGIVGMTVLEEDASIYDTTIPLGTSVTQNDPNSYDPSEVIPVTGLAATAISVTGSGGTVSDAFNVSWDDPGGFVRDTEVRYRVDGTTDYSYVQATGFVSAIITPVEPNTTYDIEARHITRAGVKSDWEAITQTSSDTSRSRAVTGTVDYSPSNQWTYNPADSTTIPAGSIDALFTFFAGGSIIATRTIRATVNATTGAITVDVNHDDTGEATTGTFTGTGSFVSLKVTHVGSGVEVFGQLRSSEIEKAVTGSVNYSQSNTWSWDPALESVSPTTTTNDAVFTFKRDGSVIATRTVRATINTSTGVISVNGNQATTGENTSVTIADNNTKEPFVLVEHDDSGVEVVGQFNTVEVEAPTAGDLTYSQINRWNWNPVDETIDPTNNTVDAVFSFKRGGSVIASRTIRGTINTTNGNITVNDSQATSGEATTPTVQGDGTQTVELKVVHDATGFEINGRFLTSRFVDLSPFITDLDTLEQDLDDLQTELDNSFPITETQISNDAISTPMLKANAITTPKIAAGAVTAIKINVGNLAAINARTGRLTSDIIQTAPAGQRVELTAPEFDSDYAIWIGDGSTSFGSITNATQADPVVITSNSHGLTTGDEIGIVGVSGMTELNGKVYTVTVINSNTFSLDGVDGTNYGAYITGGAWQDYVKSDAAGSFWIKHNGDAKIDGVLLAEGTVGVTKFENDLQSDNYDPLDPIATRQGWALVRDTGSAFLGNVVARGTMSSATYTSGSAGWEINNDGSAEFNDVVARGNLIAGGLTGDRVEITADDSTLENYRIWVGDGTKNDSNGVFWVKANGDAKIDGGTFNIGTRGDTVISANSPNLASQTANTLTVSTSDFTSNGNAVNITGVANYFASKSTSGTCSAEYSAVPASLSGNLKVQRSTNSGSTWTDVGSAIPFSAPTNTQDFGESPDPITCFASVNLDKTFTILDSSPPTGTVRYRIIYDSFVSFFLTAQNVTNRLEITALQG